MGVDYSLLESTLKRANLGGLGLVQLGRERLCERRPELQVFGWTEVLDDLLGCLLSIPMRREPAWMASELPRAGARFQHVGLSESVLALASESLREVLAENAVGPWTHRDEVQWTATIALAAALLLSGYR